ncbi:hypothetical protein BC834DRAFT_897936, partial [Gloeopeniophorella convolvens]
MRYAVICLEANFLTWWAAPRCLRPSHLLLCIASHVGNASPPFACVLQFTSDSTFPALSFALDVLPFPSPSSLPMSTQSPPLTRKPTTGSSQGLSSSPRETSPSPSLRERQRTTRGQSTGSYQGSFNGQPSPTASTASFHQRRSPPLTAQTISGSIRRATSPLAHHSTSRDGTPERLTPPPLPVHTMSQQNVHHQMPPLPHNHSQPNLLQHSSNQITPALGFARPPGRAAPPQFMSLESFQMTPELIAEIDQAHSMGAGMSGVAYAGGASSGPVSRNATQFESGSLPKESTLERVRSNERQSPRESGESPTILQRRDTARDHDRDTWERERDRELHRRGSMKRDIPPTVPTQQPSPKVEAQRTESPQYLTPLSTPGEHTASYTQYDRELRTAQSAALPPSPPASRQNVPYTEPLRTTPPSVAALTTQSPTGQSVKARTPDKSLPVQEEPEEDGTDEREQEREQDRWTPGGSDYGRHSHRHEQETRDVDRQRHIGSSPTPSSDLLPEGFDPRYDTRHERNGRDTHSQSQRKSSDETQQQHDDDDDDDDGHERDFGRTQSQDEESYTPRSPSASLPPERGFNARSSPAHPQPQSRSQQHQQQAPRIRSRNGATDQLGLRSFDAASFDRTLEQLKSLPPEHHHRSYSAPQINPARNVNSPHQVHSPSHEEPDHFLDDPAAAYYHAYPQSPMSAHSRPGAPIPPTPHSHTAAPSPSPLISGMGRANGVKPVLPPYSPAPPVGSPYPYPYGHIRRGQSYTGSQNGTMDLAQMDPNVVREQLALQMQIYALNNGGMVSDSTLSPSSTPFPGPQYNPWTFLQTSNVFGGGRRAGFAESIASMRSSPSHQPVSMPPHAARSGHRLRHGERSQDLRTRAKARPPPRVESTQPRDTSPELSSGEETAGESKVGEQHSAPRPYAPRAARWDESADDEDEMDSEEGEWIDEDIGVEGMSDDLLQLEFHTEYVSNPEKRRRRWKARWEALLRAFHTLDRETDTTLVLLAAPSHTSKHHSVASRAIRRDVALLDSPEMARIRESFAGVAARRRTSRSLPLLEQLSKASASSRDGSPSSSSDTREEDLRRALDTAIGSLHALGSLYEQREMRWVEEKHRIDDDKEKVQLLLKQVLGVGNVG